MENLGSFDDGDMAPEQNVLAAAYAIKDFSYSDRPATMNLLRKAAKWNGDVGDDFSLLFVRSAQELHGAYRS